MRARNFWRLIGTLVALALASMLAEACGGAGGGTSTGDLDGSASFDGTTFVSPKGGSDGSTTNNCVPRTCAELGATCGPQSNGCGGLVAGGCGTCTAPEFCGGGGPSTCGPTAVDGGPICTPKTCATIGNACGQTSDGCDGLVGPCVNGVAVPADAGSVCAAPQFCGGGGFNLCGLGPQPDGGDAGPKCPALTCVTIGNACGPTSDGCGNLVGPCVNGVAVPADAGSVCTAPQYCGGGGDNLCGGGGSTDGGTTDDGSAPMGCVAKTCINLAAQGITNTCGVQADDCGGLFGPCGTQTTCAVPAYCGGGGFNQCGTGVTSDGGPVSLCTPITCQSLAAQGITSTCGPQDNGCGGLVGPCGTNTMCTSPEYCGGGGFNQCGLGDAGTAASNPCNTLTCASYPTYQCGQAANGCGGLTLSCGTCPTGEYCGGGGAYECGGTAGADGGVTCIAKTCATAGYTCGLAGDGCGGVIGPCGTNDGGCPAPEVCGGGGIANVCGSNIGCTGLCPQQSLCDGGGATLTGEVVAGTISTYLPAGTLYGDPVPSVLVYIPNETTAPYVTAFTSRASETAAQQCSTCGADVSGNPLTSTYTSYNGTFTLPNVPVGTSIPIVIQLGRWRRVFTVNTSCTSTSFTATPVAVAGGSVTGTDGGVEGALPAGILMMPRTQEEGDIPLTAISTGNVDAMECVLLKMGIDQSEFTADGYTSTGGKNGRVHIYFGNGAYSSVAGSQANTPNETALMGTPTTTGTYNSYDQVVLPCWGENPVGNSTTYANNYKTDAELKNLVTYGNNGGHFFATHYSYVWLATESSGNVNTNNTYTTPYSTTANWDLNRNTNIAGTSTNGTVSQVVPPPTATPPGVFVEWLNNIDALVTNSAPPPPDPAYVSIANWRHDVDSVATEAMGNEPTAWITGEDPGHGDQAMTLHYTFDTPVDQTAQCGHAIFSDFHVNNSNSAGDSFPSGAATECGNTAMTSQEKILEYMIWDLASCVPAPPSASCTPQTCKQQGFNCGQAGNGCGSLIDGGCGPCAAGEVCGGNGQAYQCAAACTPLTCGQQNIACGAVGDGCGNIINQYDGGCGTCTSPASCVAGQCVTPDAGAGTCAPETCGQQGFNCGQAGNGCGGTIDGGCGTCPTGQTCGACGQPGQCCAPDAAAGTCVPQTCTQQGINCGPASDGCGDLIDGGCGSCATGQQCGGPGASGVCVAIPDAGGCVPVTCQQQGLACGPTGDGCGNVIASCGTCTAPQTCGGCGTPGVCCGTNPCQPESCQEQGIECGPTGDGCGNLLNCGECDGGTCGGGGTGLCGPGSCTPKTCTEQGFNCGPAGDGCGNLIPTCGTCTPPLSCGGGGSPGVCGQPTVTPP